MSLYDLMDKTKLDPGFAVAQNPSTEFGDVFSASLESTARNRLFNSKEFFEDRETNDRDQRYKELTGRDLYEDAFAGQPLEQGQKLRFETTDAGRKVRMEQIDRFLAERKGTDPERFKEIYTSAEITETVKRKALEASKTETQAMAGATGFSRLAGSLAGGVTASLIDPLNLATMPIAAAKGAGILKTALVEAGANVGAEVLSHPSVSSWQKELGNEYGFKDLAENAGMAAVFGAAIGGGAKALELGLSKSAAMGELSRGFDEMGNSMAARAAKMEERRLHIEEANPSRLSSADMDPDILKEWHASAVREMDAALNEGRALNPEKVGITNEQFKALDPKKMDEGSAKVFNRITEDNATAGKAAAERNYQRFQKKLKGEQAGKKSKAKAMREHNEMLAKFEKQKTNELLDFSKPEAPTPEKHAELMKLQESPQMVAREKVDFEEKFKDRSDDRVFMEDEKADLSVDQIRKAEKEDADYFKAISSCGLALT